MSRKYPSQDDAQVLIDIMNHPRVYTGGSSKEFSKLASDFNAMPKNWTRLHNKAFGTQSPWSYDFNPKSNKRVLRWDNIKSEKLKL